MFNATFDPNILPWYTMRDFSKRYCSIFAPSIVPPELKKMSMYFPNLEELSFLTVFAFPNAYC